MRTSFRSFIDMIRARTRDGYTDVAARIGIGQSYFSLFLSGKRGPAANVETRIIETYRLRPEDRARLWKICGRSRAQLMLRHLTEEQRELVSRFVGLLGYLKGDEIETIDRMLREAEERAAARATIDALPENR